MSEKAENKEAAKDVAENKEADKKTSLKNLFKSIKDQTLHFNRKTIKLKKGDSIPEEFEGMSAKQKKQYFEK